MHLTASGSDTPATFLGAEDDACRTWLGLALIAGSAIVRSRMGGTVKQHAVS